MNKEIFYHLNSHRIFFWLFIAAFCCQLFLWHKFENFKTPSDIVPQAPNQYLVSASSFGDNEFLFRILAMRLQNSGDVFAGFVSLKNYDYSRVYDWMTALDTLNDKSRLVPSLASYYYSQTTKKEDNRYIVKYLEEHSIKNIDANWWWLFQAVFIAKANLKDLDLALDLAKKLAQNNAKEAPFWTKQMPAFISAEKGEDCVAFKLIQELIIESESGKYKVSPDDMGFMRHFINERLSKLKNQKFDPKKC
jgi:hypothetical protein